nr:hypothetical protein L203_01343 [Cryptococcus depauperatus CBS 7841]
MLKELSLFQSHPSNSWNDYDNEPTVVVTSSPDTSCLQEETAQPTIQGLATCDEDIDEDVDKVTNVNLENDGSLPKVSRKQTMDQLRQALEQMNLNTKGKKETLYKRAVNHIQAINAMTERPSWPSLSATSDAEEGSNPWECGSFPPDSVLAAHFAEKEARRAERRLMKESGQTYKSFLCFDVEATCRGGREFDYPNEIIEFPVVLLRWGAPNNEGKRILERVDSFRSYVRPTWRLELTDFCKSLTGISQQETVDASPTFPQVLKMLEEWMDKWDLRGEKGLKDALWVTDGPWDLRDFIPKQLHITPTNPLPNYFHGPYLNVKRAVQSVMSEINARRVYAAAHPDNAANEWATQPISTSRKQGRWKPDNRAARHGQKSPQLSPDITVSPDSPEVPVVKKKVNYYQNITGMCEALGLGDFEGRQHSGLDDAINIGRILIALSKKNVVFEANGDIQPIGSEKRYPWMGENGKVLWEEWMSSQNLQIDSNEKNLKGVMKDVQEDMNAELENKTIGEGEETGNDQDKPLNEDTVKVEHSLGQQNEDRSEQYEREKASIEVDSQASLFLVPRIMRNKRQFTSRSATPT